MRVGKTPGLKATCYVLTAAMVLGFPGPVVVHAAGPTAPAANPGSLSVETDPVGATVLVDGQSWGVTPLAERNVAPGDHRVRVVKDGYLDNSRVVSVQPGQTGRVRVSLTPNREKSGARAQRDTTAPPQQDTDSGGSSKKWLWIGLGAAAVGAGAYFLLTGNDPPTPGTIGTSPSATGMAGITTYTFSAQGASDPDGDPLTYEWAFGDGGTGSGATASRVYASAGTFSVSLTVSDGKHRVTAPAATVTVGRSMAGAWTGGNDPGFTGTSISYTLTQSGTSLGGSITKAGGLVGTITGVTGTVSATTYPANVTMATPAYGIGVAGVTVTDRYTGTTDGAGNTITGTCTVVLTGATFTATGSSTATGACTLRR